MLFAQTEKKYELDKIVVTGLRTPSNISSAIKEVIVLSSEEIKKIPANSIQELLKYFSGIDIRNRGVEGVQTDISIRGGTFEQTLILIDGIKMSDPQTGHHNANLPISIDVVERIEILKGDVSGTYGPNAFSGVINLITKSGQERYVKFKTTGGENAFFEGSAGLSIPLGITSNYISVSKKKSDGYRHNTNFDIVNFFVNSSSVLEIGKVNLLYGYNDKSFGANSFYTDRFPGQWENTTTQLLTISGNLGSHNLFLVPKVFWRKHFDDYMLDYTNPSFYRNKHTSNSYGIEIQTTFISNAGKTSLGAEIIFDELESSNLGNHNRGKKGVLSEHLFSPIEKLNIVIGAFAYNYSSIGWKIWPSFSFSYSEKPELRFWGSAGKAFRLPSFTELYYKSPASNGNPNLRYEETTNYQIGVNTTLNNVQFNISLFHNKANNIIDWVRENKNFAWRSENISKISTNGAEINLYYKTVFPLIEKISVGYTYLHSDKSIERLESRYALDHLRHQLIAIIFAKLQFNVANTWSFRYEDRVNFENHFLIDVLFSKIVENVNIYLRINNLLNKSYKDIAGVPLPGRWIFLGLETEFRF
jgi:iron complex outermembrane receptor protein